ncbi:hypothetical protein ACFL3D_03060 [Candidatus Omnitrophota bacterium]
MNNLTQKLSKAVLMPLKAFRIKYLPLLVIYFAYGASGLIDLPLSFWIKENLALTAVQLASVAVWASLPWTIKMIFGQMLDSVRIFGSRRKVYVFIGAACTSAGLCVLASMAGRYAWVNYFGSDFVTFLIAKMLIILGFVIQDVTADTMTTEVVSRSHTIVDQTGELHIQARDQKEIKHDLAMVQILGRLALYAGLISVAKLSGTLVTYVTNNEAITYVTIFWASLIIPAISCIGALFVRTDEIEESSVETPCKTDSTIVVATLMLGCATIGIGLGKIMWSEMSTIFAYSDEMIFSVSLIILLWMVRHIMRHEAPEKQRILYFTLTALFVYRLTPHVGEGLLWWMLDVLKFDPQYLGTLRLIASVVPLVILWFFSELIASSSVKKILLFLIVVGTFMSLPEVVLYYGGDGIRSWARNIMICDTVLESPLANISMIPLLTVIAFFAPLSNRGTWFAVGTSFLNLALTGSALFTKYLNLIFTVKRTVFDPVTGVVVTQADYSQLGVLMICKIIFMATVPLVVVMLCFKKEHRA